MHADNKRNLLKQKWSDTIIMKKVLAVILSLTMACSLMACGGASMEGETTPAPDTETEAPANDAEDAEPAENAGSDAAGATEWIWPSKEELHVGYSQADLASTWRTVESDDMQRVADERGYKITIVNAEGDTEQQLSDVESLLAQGCNVIVITAVDGDAIQPALDACKEKGVPVIMKARGSNGVPGVDYVTFFSSDFVAEGRYAGEWIAKACADKETIKVAEIQGILGGTDVRDRSGGFHEVADKEGNFDFVVEQTANFSRTEAQEVAANVLQSTNGEIDAFYCHNDEMALGVSLACQSAGLKINEDVYIVGVDGMYETFDAIKDGTVSATITCTPKFAEQVFDGIEAGIAGETLETFYAIEDVPVDATNVEENYDLGF